MIMKLNWIGDKMILKVKVRQLDRRQDDIERKSESGTILWETR